MSEIMSGRALLVEDDADYAFVLGTVLRREGYAVTTMQDDAAAVRSMKRESPDLVLLDLDPPVPSGEEVLQELRAKYPETPVIVVSDEPDAGAHMHAVGATTVLAKPVHLQDLLTTLADVATSEQDTHLGRAPVVTSVH